MSRWTHAICAKCWNQRNPNRQAVKLAPDDVEKERCCFCGDDTIDGIYTRHEPNELRCKGEHEASS